MKFLLTLSICLLEAARAGELVEYAKSCFNCLLSSETNLYCKDNSKCYTSEIDIEENCSKSGSTVISSYLSCAPAERLCSIV